MTDFEYDCLQKKRIAGQAKYRKRGSKSKKCTLPSDRMTQKQWKERCGPVITYNPNKPMDWGSFKQMPTYIQSDYITNLQKQFGVTAVDLGNMFGVRALTVRKHAEANGLDVEFPRGHAMSSARKVAWESFLREEDNDDTVDTELIQEEPQPKEEDVATNVETRGMNMKKFSLQFTGVIDVSMISNSLRLILGDNSEGALEIICNLD